MIFGRTKSKYRAKRSELDGYKFASGLERGVYLLLKAMAQHGELRIERVQDRVLLGPAKIDYRPDFRVTDLASNKTVWVEAKGFETPAWRIKLKLWIAHGPGELRIYKGTEARPFLFKTVIPEGEACSTNG